MSSLATAEGYNNEPEPLPSKKWREVIVAMSFNEVVTILEKKVDKCWNYGPSLILSAGSEGIVDINEELGQAEFIRETIIPRTVALTIRVNALSDNKTQVMTRLKSLFGKNGIMKGIVGWLNGSKRCSGK